MPRHCLGITLLTAFLVALPIGRAFAQEPAAENDLAQLFVVPDTDEVPKLARFLQRLIEFEPQSREDDQVYRRKAPLAMRKAAEKLIAIEKDKSSKSYRMAKGHLLSEQATKLTEGEASDGARKVLLNDILKFVASAEPSADDFGLAAAYAFALEIAPARALATEAYSKFGQIFSESKDPELARQGKMLLGAARRLNLVGQPLELKGTTVDGQPFDLASLRGKVVLVDFWATWCEPCLAELPNIKKNYETYNPRGFEVVSVSLDHDRAALEEFLSRVKSPWTTLHDKEKMGKHPATIEYGIFGLPSVILVGKDGKVISMQARGDELGRHLKELLPE